jgi:hypothetical protein
MGQITFGTTNVIFFVFCFVGTAVTHAKVVRYEPWLSGGGCKRLVGGETCP